MPLLRQLDRTDLRVALQGVPVVARRSRHHGGRFLQAASDAVVPPARTTAGAAALPTKRTAPRARWTRAGVHDQNPRRFR